MKFLPGAKVSKGVMILEVGHCSGAGWYRVLYWSLRAQLPTFECQLTPDSL